VLVMNLCLPDKAGALDLLINCFSSSNLPIKLIFC